MPFRVLIVHTNTGPSTLNDGVATSNIVNPGGGAIAANTLIAGGIYEFILNGSDFQLMG
jgi:hypothetical protein